MLVTLLVSNKYTTKLPTAGIKNIYELFSLVFFVSFPIIVFKNASLARSVSATAEFKTKLTRISVIKTF